MANRESGEPGSTSRKTIHWTLNEDGIHTGAFQWDRLTWEEGGGAAYASEAMYATPEQQLKVFKHFYPGHESRWAQTAPFC